MFPLDGVAATPFICNPDGSDGQQAFAYADATSPSRGNMVTDASGNVSYYLDPGNYNIHFADQKLYPRIKSFVRGFTSISVISAAEIATLNGDIADLVSAKWSTYAKSIPQQEPILSSAYTTLTTPDSVEIVTAGAQSYIGIWYRAIWQETVAGDARAAIFVESDQLKVPSVGNPVTQAAATTGGVNIDKPLSSFAGGLISAGAAGTSYGSDVTTGQAQAIANVNGQLAYDLAGTAYATSVLPMTEGGPCWIFMPFAIAGSAFTVSVRFKAATGGGFVRNRVLRVAMLPINFL